MRCLLLSLCVVAIAVSPAAASANTKGEAVSTKPIVIAYIPEHLQHRVPGHQHKHQANVPLEPAPEKTPEEQRKNRRIIIGVSVSLALLAMGAAIGAGIMSTVDFAP